ncbi:MAG: polyprenol monophosphomannose synthase [Verrucomicrobia bacterium]|nr:polyprenol monophosphomannose synthase [Verrucomicrobiota bacterium]
MKLIVIPTYNEMTNLPPLVEKLLLLSDDVHLLIVDDNSPDGTGTWVQEQSEKNARIHLLSRQQKNGLGRAYLAGFQWALEHQYEIIVQMDADFSHSPDDVPKLIAAVEAGADLAIGSRYIYGVRVINWPLRRLILSIGASYYVHLVTGLPIHDPTGGFKCWRRQTLQEIDMPTVQSNGYGFQIEMTHRAWRKGFSITEVPIIFTDRFQGTSKMSWNIVFEAFFMVWKLLFQAGLRRVPKKGYRL